MPNFGDTLRELRASRGVKLGELARRLGFKPSYMSDIELGRRAAFRPIEITRVAEALQLNEAEVLALLRAAMLERGRVELTMPPDNPAAAETGAALQRQWSALPAEAFEEINNLMRKYGKE